MRWGRRVTLGLLIAVFATAAPAGAQTFAVTVGGARAIRPISASFLGVAFEYRSMPVLAGDARTLNPVLVQLIRNLSPRPVLRIGGISTDRTWWPVRGIKQPRGITYGLTQGWIDTIRALASKLNARLILGVGLEANQPAIDRVEAQHLLSIGRTRIAALEIGNEPELYTAIAWYRELHGRPIPWYATDGTPIFNRPRGYGPSAFESDFSRALSQLGTVPIAGPETGLTSWLGSFEQRFVSRSSPVKIVTWHAYGLNNCDNDPSGPHYPTVPNLLATTASRQIAPDIPPYIGRAHGAGASFRIDEMGSITCNGRAGVSNTFASALWALDALFTVAAEGVDGVNLHTFQNSVNGLFDFARPHGRWQGIVHPLYYGALMFAQAAPPGSRLLQVQAGSQTQVRAWATAGPDHKIRVLLINDSIHGSARAVVRVPAAGGTGSVERLRSISAYATSGVKLGGESFGARTSTGVLAAPKPVSARPNGGAYEVSMPPASAALLTLEAPHKLLKSRFVRAVRRLPDKFALP